MSIILYPIFWALTTLFAGALLDYTISSLSDMVMNVSYSTFVVAVFRMAVIFHALIVFDMRKLKKDKKITGKENLKNFFIKNLALSLMICWLFVAVFLLKQMVELLLWA